MHIGKILRECVFKTPDAYGGFMASGHQTLAFLKDMHPLQVINSSVVIPLFCIKYEYDTMRNNHRKGEKFYFGNVGGVDSFEQEVLAEGYLTSWVDEFNRKNPYRAISNVKILEVAHIANACLKLQ